MKKIPILKNKILRLAFVLSTLLFFTSLAFWSLSWRTLTTGIGNTSSGSKESAVKVLSERSSGVVRGGIIPHHLLAKELIDDFFKRIATNKSVTIVLVGPNHFELGNSKVISCQAGCGEFLQGTRIDEELVSQLAQSEEIGLQKEIIEQENSIVALAPFVRKYLPNAKLVPLAMSKRADLKFLEDISALIDDYSKNKETIIVASVDFSHYLSSLEAELMDGQSLEAIKKKDYQMLKGFGSEHMDSPESLILLLKVAEKSGIDLMDILDHANSGEMLADPSSLVTSYYSIIFEK